MYWLRFAILVLQKKLCRFGRFFGALFEDFQFSPLNRWRLTHLREYFYQNIPFQIWKKVCSFIPAIKHLPNSVTFYGIHIF